MVKISVGNTMGIKFEDVYEASTPVREVLERFAAETGTNYNFGSWNINGFPVRDFDKTFGELGYDEKDIYLINVVNAKNA